MLPKRNPTTELLCDFYTTRCRSLAAVSPLTGRSRLARDSLWRASWGRATLRIGIRPGFCRSFVVEDAGGMYMEDNSELTARVEQFKTGIAAMEKSLFAEAKAKIYSLKAGRAQLAARMAAKTRRAGESADGVAGEAPQQPAGSPQAAADTAVPAEPVGGAPQPAAGQAVPAAPSTATAAATTARSSRADRNAAGSCSDPPPGSNTFNAGPQALGIRIRRAGRSLGARFT
ncbi:unnamed protein product [Prorocentrum cordatum]|uniref:Uncharacterized protein n=1 Tax=Prorocentrum cordatum TaxID=2364126 RepID=A0ABN9UNP3_9DINO|nr:unnamed protein product [Polarella glacialis]